MKFHENPSSGNLVFPRGRLGQAEGRTDLTKLIVAFRNFAHAPKNSVSDNRIFELVHIDTT